MRVQRPVRGDLALQTQLGTVRREKQFDCRRVETDPMVERRHLMSFVHAADGDHRLENLDRPDQPRIAGEQRLECERPVGLDDEIDPVPGDVDSREFADVDDLVGLHEDHPVAKCGGLSDRRRVLGVGTGEQVAISVGLRRAQQRDVGGQVGEHPRVQLDVGVDGADADLAVLHHLRDADTLGSGVGEVELCGDLLLEQVEMFRPRHRRDQHVQAVDLAGIALGQRAGQEISLLLVVALEGDAIARPQQRLQRLAQPAGVDHLAVDVVLDGGEPVVLVGPAAVPGGRAHPPVASMMRSATSRALETIDRWLASSSIVLAFIRLAMNRSRSGLIVRSFFDTA